MKISCGSRSRFPVVIKVFGQVRKIRLANNTGWKTLHDIIADWKLPRMLLQKDHWPLELMALFFGLSLFNALKSIKLNTFFFHDFPLNGPTQRGSFFGKLQPSTKVSLSQWMYCFKCLSFRSLTEILKYQTFITGKARVITASLWLPYESRNSTTRMLSMWTKLSRCSAVSTEQIAKQPSNYNEEHLC